MKTVLLLATTLAAATVSAGDIKPIFVQITTSVGSSERYFERGEIQVATGTDLAGNYLIWNPAGGTTALAKRLATPITAEAAAIALIRQQAVQTQTRAAQAAPTPATSSQAADMSRGHYTEPAFSTQRYYERKASRDAAVDAQAGANERWAAEQRQAAASSAADQRMLEMESNAVRLKMQQDEIAQRQKEIQFNADRARMRQDELEQARRTEQIRQESEKASREAKRAMGLDR